MKILWVVNTHFSDLCRELSLRKGGSGYWLETLAKSLVEKREVSLVVVSFSSCRAHSGSYIVDGVKYIVAFRAQVASLLGGNRHLGVLKSLIIAENPDIVDFHGTEFGYAKISPALECPVLVTLQGFVNASKNFYFSDLGLLRYIRALQRAGGTWRSTAKSMYSYFTIPVRCRAEINAIKVNKYFIGRTSYDEQYIRSINPSVRAYFTAHRILRACFYKTVWLGGSVPARLFTCSRLAPGKGIDVLMRATAKLAASGIDVELRIAGGSPPFEGWGLYLERLAIDLGILGRIKFLGYLNSEQIAEEHSRSNVYIMPSYIENSPNSLAEAMAVGIPCVTTNAGGAGSMVENGVSGYVVSIGDFDLMAERIMLLLRSRENASWIGANARAAAAARHSPCSVVSATYNAYQAVIHDHATSK